MQAHAYLGEVMRAGIVAFLAVASVASLQAQERPPIIDMHMHARVTMARTPDGNPLPRMCFPKPCTEHPAVALADDDVLRLSLEAMERNNIVLGFLSDPLEQVYRWVNAAPDRFIASPLVWDPDDVDIDDLRQEYEAGKLRGMGELATQYRGYAPNDPALDPLFALAVEFDVPVLIHTEGIAGGSPAFRIADGHPELLQEVLIEHPQLRLYMENAGFPFLEEAISLMYRYPNVYADLSTITWIIPREVFYNYFEGLMDAGLGKRLMFGSDQMYWPESIDLAIDAIELAPFLSEEQKRDIFYNNAARFLRLEGSH
jgi:predicted TIM-barrel fold metal-dependent hydrolase